MPESEEEFEAHKELMHELISFPNFVTPDFEADMLKDTNDELNHEEASCDVSEAFEFCE